MILFEIYINNQKFDYNKQIISDPLKHNFKQIVSKSAIWDKNSNLILKCRILAKLISVGFRNKFFPTIITEIFFA